jgi:L-tartrate/succinate antiporter
MVKKTTKLEFGWTDWFIAFAPVGILLLLAMPLLAYWLYPPQIKQGDKVPAWAAQELDKLGTLTRREIILALLVLIALALWIFGADHINATTVALLVVSLMLVTGVLSWDDIVRHSAAWNTFTWFATLLTLADGLNRVGFVKWFAESIAQHMSGLAPITAMLLLVTLFFFIHYMFASIIAHVTAVLPVMLAIGATIPGMPLPQYAMLLCLTLGIMGILSPYATGPSPVYYGSGYLPSRDYWRLGAVFGVIFLITLFGIGTPWLFGR